MPDDEGFAFPDRKGSGRPNCACILVAQINNFAGRVADSVVGPWREAVFPAVDRPGVSGARFRHLESEVLPVCDDV